MFRISDSQMSMTYNFHHSRQPLITIVEETQNGVTKTLPRKELEAYELPLYRSADPDSGR